MLRKNFKLLENEQDKFAFKSQKKALTAQKENKFKEEIVNLKIKSTKSELILIKMSTLEKV